jgi:single-stranded-DNA-specific exonuclease
VVELMALVPPGVLLQFGGHAASGGFTVSSEGVHTLEKELSDAYRTMDKKFVDDAVSFDHELGINDVTWDTWNEVEAFAPFGMENPKPVFLFSKAEIVGVRKFGKANEHLELEFRNAHGGKVAAIGFFITEKDFPEVLLGRGEKVDLIATMEKSMFRNYPELRLRIVDILK